MNTPQGSQGQVDKIKRVSDQSCTIHSILRDRYAGMAKALDYLLIIASTYLLGLTFIEPVTGVLFSLGFDQTKVVAIVSIVTFLLSIVQFKSDWKSKAEGHARSADEYAKIKSNATFLLTCSNPDPISIEKLRDSYDVISKIGTHIPDSYFLSGKQKHLKKIFISRYLDSHPGASIRIIKIKLFLHDNFGVSFFD